MPRCTAGPEKAGGIFAGKAGCADDTVVEFLSQPHGIVLNGTYEEILSGSQGVGFEGRNEVFPHTTSSNCPLCTNRYIEGIKNFNATYNIKHLRNIEKCPRCYPLWQDIMKSNDSRSIRQRIKDIFNIDKKED